MASEVIKIYEIHQMKQLNKPPSKVSTSRVYGVCGLSVFCKPVKLKHTFVRVCLYSLNAPAFLLGH